MIGNMIGKYDWKKFPRSFESDRARQAFNRLVVYVHDGFEHDKHSRFVSDRWSSEGGTVL